MTANISTISIFLLLAVMSVSCARRESDAEGSADTTPPTSPVQQQSPSSPPPQLSAVKIEVSLSPEAEQKLKSIGETVRVEVVYGGDAAPDATIAPNELNLIELSKSVHELDGSGTLDLSEDDLDKSRLDQIVGQPQLIVNVVSGKKTSQNNLLACDFYWDTLISAGQNGVRIPCALIDEASQG